MPSMMSMPGTTAQQHAFSIVPKADIPRSSFVRNNGLKTTFNAGYLVPIFIDEVLPGDTFNLKMAAFARLATPLTPFMDNLVMDTFFFFVPNRLIWNNWEKFNGAQDNPGDSTSFLTPQMVAPASIGYAPPASWTSPTTAQLNSALADYFGLPTGVPGFTHNSLPFRAYNLIWNQWFRDENLQTSAVVDKGDGPDTVTNYVLRKRGKRHDYFTSCLPWPQKGPSVNLPLGGSAPVLGIGIPTGGRSAAPAGIINSAGVDMSGTNSYKADQFATYIAADAAKPLIYADLTAVTAATINQLRQSIQIQRLYERDARGGTRYTEIILSHFGVVSDDARLNRPEYLGGGSSPVVVNPIAQTSAVPSQPTPQGNLAAIGTTAIHGHGFVKSFTEHGFVIGLVNVRADLNYQQGLDRMWSRSTRFDYYWPALAHIGEQAVLNQEIYCQGSAAPTVDAAVFGYQERYAEYRYKPSKITGQFRSTFATPLDQWHLAQKFTSLPTLSDTFIQDSPPVERVLAVPSYPHFLFDADFHYVCARPMPVYSVPGQMDHF